MRCPLHPAFARTWASLCLVLIAGMQPTPSGSRRSSRRTDGENGRKGAKPAHPALQRLQLSPSCLLLVQALLPSLPVSHPCHLGSLEARHRAAKSQSKASLELRQRQRVHTQIIKDSACHQGAHSSASSACWALSPSVHGVFKPQPTVMHVQGTRMVELTREGQLALTLPPRLWETPAPTPTHSCTPICSLDQPCHAACLLPPLAAVHALFVVI